MAREIEACSEDPRLQLQAASVVNCLQDLEGVTAPVPEGSLAVVFVDPASCSQLHGDFFGDPSVTDVMTFPGDPEDDHAGDIAICPEVAAAAALEHGLSFAEELTLYLVHAWLHLGGLRDKTAAEQAAMRAAEDAAMKHLRATKGILQAEWHG